MDFSLYRRRDQVQKGSKYPRKSLGESNMDFKGKDLCENLKERGPYAYLLLVAA